MDSPEEVGRRLRVARTAVGLQQQEVAERVGVSRVSVSNWERGVSLPSDENLTQLAELYRTTKSALRYGASVVRDESQQRYAESREGKVTESPEIRLSETPRAMRNHRVRVWLAEFRMELTKAQATDEEIEAAIALVTSPDVFTFYSGGKPRDFTEDQVIDGMEAMAKVVRARLKQLGRKVR